MNKPFALAVLLVSLIIVSCKDDTKIGNELQPGKDKLSVFTVDTIPFEVNSFSPDSLRSNSLNQFLFGGYYDEVFGMSRGHFITQLRFDSLRYIGDAKTDRNNIVLDSIFFVIPYTSYFGDSLSLNEVRVYELQKSINNFQEYYSNYDIKSAYNENELLGSLFYRAADENNIIIKDNTTGANLNTYALKIPLKMELAQHLLDNIDLYNGSVEKFWDFFKGVCVVSSFGTESFIQIGPLATYVRMEMHYHDVTEFLSDSIVKDTIWKYSATDTTFTVNYDYFTKVKPRQQDFYVNSECGRFAVIENDFSNSQLNPKGTDPKDPYAYIRGGGAMRARIKFPKLQDRVEFAPLPGEDSSRIVVNSAKLIMKIDNNAINVNKFIPPDYIAAYADYGDTIVKVNDLVFGWDYFGGSLNLFDFSYTINISSFIQNALVSEDGVTPDLVIGVIDEDKNALSEAYFPYFTILNSASNTEDPMKFEIVYTRY